MKKGKGEAPDAPAVPIERIRSIASTTPPSDYTSVGATGARARRHAVYKQAVVTLAHGEELPVVVRNLSPTGCRLEFFKQVYPRGRIRLVEQSLPIDTWASVVWNGEGACGVEFEESEALAEKIRASSPTRLPDAPVRSALAPSRKERSRIRKR